MLLEASDPEGLFHPKWCRDSNTQIIVPAAFTGSFLEVEWQNRSDRTPLLGSVPRTSGRKDGPRGGKQGALREPNLGCAAALHLWRHRPQRPPLPPAVPRSRPPTQLAPRPAADGGAARGAEGLSRARGWLTCVCKHCEAVGGAGSALPRPAPPHRPVRETRPGRAEGRGLLTGLRHPP